MAEARKYAVVVDSAPHLQKYVESMLEHVSESIAIVRELAVVKKQSQ